MKKISYIASSIVMMSFLIHALSTVKYAIPEVFVSIVCLFIIRYIDKKIKLTTTNTTLLCIGTTLHPLGVFGLYSHFILFDLIGYDKLVHLFVSFTLTYTILKIAEKHIILNISENKNALLAYTVAILTVMGLGAILEINEFIGEAYFGINTGGLFTMSDTLPEIRSDLQKYDTYYDMIFNLIGSVVGALTIAIKKKT